MKPVSFICMALMMVLCFSACGESVEESTNTETVILREATEQQKIPETTESEYTEENAEKEYQIFRQPEEITVFPFSEEEMESARIAATATIEQMKAEPGTLAFEVEGLAFDPMLTDIHVRQKIAASQVTDWSESDYYSHYMSFTLIYSAVYDHSTTFRQDVNHDAVGIHLYREQASSAWTKESEGIPVAEYSNLILNSEELDSLGTEGERILAGYRPNEKEYWLYRLDEKTGTVIYEIRPASNIDKEEPAQTEPVKTEETEETIKTEPAITGVVFPALPESVPQSGEPIQPQPGDTTSTWDMAREAEFPRDEGCTDMEFLEKWMAVEGLNFSALDDLGCNQLILVAARETDGVQTYTTCYDRQEDNSWAPAAGLTRMHGHTGSNGIAHNRKRNTNTTPAGLWRLGTAFGNGEKPEGIQMPWRDVTPNSDWVCDGDSVYFNTWQERNDPALTETWNYDDVEHLQDYLDSYAYACVIQYNTPPYTIPDRGCAIFLHCSQGATGGCVGLSEPDMIKTLLWLDQKENPCILITGYQNG